MSKSPEHVAYINNARQRIQRTHPESCNFFNLTTKDNVVLDAITLRHRDHTNAAMADTKWIVSYNKEIFSDLSLSSLSSSFHIFLSLLFSSLPPQLLLSSLSLFS